MTATDTEVDRLIDQATPVEPHVPGDLVAQVTAGDLFDALRWAKHAVPARPPVRWAALLITSGALAVFSAWLSLRAAVVAFIPVAGLLAALSICLTVQVWEGGLVVSALLTGLLSLQASVTSILCSRHSPVDNLGLRALRRHR